MKFRNDLDAEITDQRDQAIRVRTWGKFKACAWCGTGVTTICTNWGLESLFTILCIDQKTSTDNFNNGGWHVVDVLGGMLCHGCCVSRSKPSCSQHSHGDSWWDDGHWIEAWELHCKTNEGIHLTFWRVRLVWEFESGAKDFAWIGTKTHKTFFT